MQISSSTYSTLPVPVNYRRDDVAERRQNARGQSQQIDSAGQPQQSAPRGEVTRIRARAAAEVQNADAELRKSADATDSRNRSALQAYRSNGPSIEERLGVELAGVDVYA